MKAWICALVLCVAASAQADCRVRSLSAVRHYGHGHYGHEYFKQAFVVHQVGSGLREEAIAKRAVEEALPAIKEEIKAQYEGQVQQLREQLNGILSGKICVEFGGVSFGKARAPGGAATGKDAAVQAILDKHNCARCHTGKGSRGGDFDLRDVSQLDELTKRKIEFQVGKGLMPPKGEGEPVGDDEAQTLSDWIAELP